MKETLKEVIVEISQGLVQSVKVPEGVRVIVRDYDDAQSADESEIIHTDDGPCVEYIWDHEGA